MEKVITKRQLKIVTENKRGMLAEVSGTVADRGVNIENICAYSSNGKATFYLMTNDNEKARDALKGKGYQIEETEVIVLQVWNRPGALSTIVTEFRQAGMDLQYVYGTSSLGGEKMTIIFSSDDNSKAAGIFDTMILEEAEMTV